MQFYSPVRLFLGSDIGNFLSQLKDGNVLIISSKSAAKISGAFADVTEYLNEIHLQFFYEDTVRPNPTVQSLDALRLLYKDLEIKNIISIGGGSVIDSAKVLSLSLPNCKNCRELIEGDISHLPSLNHLSIPTTCGTGSETSKGAIISDYEIEWKGGIRGENVMCDSAFLNPKYISQMPVDLCLRTGFDAVTHAVETYISKASTPLTRTLSVSALKLLLPVLVKISKKRDLSQVDPSDLQNLLLGSSLSGINLANSTTCLPHRLQYCIGAVTNSTHVDGVALLYPAWISNLRNEGVDQLDNLNREIRQIVPELEAAEPLLQFLDMLRITKTSSEIGVNHHMKKKLVSLSSGTLDMDPGYQGNPTLDYIFEETLKCKQ